MTITEDKTKRRGINWEKEIVEYLKEHPNGCTITEIADKDGGLDHAADALGYLVWQLYKPSQRGLSIGKM